MKQLLVLAVCLVSLFTFSQNEKVDELTVQLAYQNQDSTKVDMSLMLIKELFDIDDYRKALLYINETSKLSKKINYTKGLAESSYYRALIFSERKDYFNAIDNYTKSKSYYFKIKDTLGIAKVSNSMGLVEIRRGNYAVGLQNALFAIDIFEKQGLKEELSKAYSNLAEAYFKTKQYDKALEFNFKALEVYQLVNDRKEIIRANKNIAKLYSLRKEHRKAIEYYENVLQFLNLETDKTLRGEILPKLGSEYLQFKEFDKASEYLIEGLKYNRSQGNYEGLLLALNATGKLNLQNNNIQLAEIQLNEAYEIAQKIDNKDELLENYKLQVALDSTRGNFQDAFLWQNKFYQLKEALSEKDTPAIPEQINPLEELNSSIEGNPIEEEDTLAIGDKSWISKPFVSLGLIALVIISLALLAFTILKSKKYENNFFKQKKKLAVFEEKNKELEKEVHCLEEVNEVKDKLFSIVSHDLKDSISSIKAFLDLLREDSISEAEFRELIPELSETANNASSLLYNLLNWSKSQMQNLEPKPQLFNIQEVFHNKIALVEQKIEDKRIILIDESQPDFIYADKSMIEIVIQNLITNAVKFSRSSDVITVSNQDLNEKSLICIEDTGIGISKENVAKLFTNNNFTTVGTKNEKGTGLGLNIAKDLLELNGGRIWVESTQNVGSKFFIELPKTAPKT
jgi:signal transduction histidine kinase